MPAFEDAMPRDDGTNDLTNGRGMDRTPDRSPDTVHKAIIFEDVSIAFDDIPVLNGVSFELRRGETKVILGVAGSGKSTILKLCLGLLKPDSGHIYVLGHDITTM
ncbi:MAG: transporter, ATPase subunit, partial [Candidatus Angelobacter sp.]|nr:transporter, ATPase subunit [Candidatus Angelobacter sp.]